MGFESAPRKLRESSQEKSVDPAEVLSVLEKLRRMTNRTKAVLGAAALSSALVAPAEASWFDGGSTVTRGEGVKHVTDEGHGFQSLHQQDGVTWRIEYVPQEKDGDEFLAERLVKIVDSTGERTVLGEYDNLYDAARGASLLPDLPPEVRIQMEADAAPLLAEKKRQAKLRAEGLMAPDGESPK